MRENRKNTVGSAQLLLLTWSLFMSFDLGVAEHPAANPERIKINGTEAFFSSIPYARRDCHRNIPPDPMYVCNTCPMNLFVIMDRLPEEDKDILEQMKIAVKLIQRYYHNPLNSKILLIVNPNNTEGHWKPEPRRPKMNMNDFSLKDVIDRDDGWYFERQFLRTLPHALTRVINATKTNRTNRDPVDEFLAPQIPTVCIILTDAIMHRDQNEVPDDLDLAFELAQDARDAGAHVVSFEMGRETNPGGVMRLGAPKYFLQPYPYDPEEDPAQRNATLFQRLNELVCTTCCFRTPYCKQCECPLELHFAVESGASLGEEAFYATRDFFNIIVRGFETFSGIRRDISFFNDDVNNILQMSYNKSYPWTTLQDLINKNGTYEGGPTYIDRALITAGSQLGWTKWPQSGWDAGRTMVFLTKGESQNPGKVKHLAAELRKAWVDIIPIGIDSLSADGLFALSHDRDKIKILESGKLKEAASIIDTCLLICEPCKDPPPADVCPIGVDLLILLDRTIDEFDNAKATVRALVKRFHNDATPDNRVNHTGHRVAVLPYATNVTPAIVFDDLYLKSRRWDDLIRTSATLRDGQASDTLSALRKVRYEYVNPKDPKKRMTLVVMTDGSGEDEKRIREEGVMLTNEGIHTLVVPYGKNPDTGVLSALAEDASYFFDLANCNFTQTVSGDQINADKPDPKCIQALYDKICRTPCNCCPGYLGPRSVDNFWHDHGDHSDEEYMVSEMLDFD